jgi:hypothetical protein
MLLFRTKHSLPPPAAGGAKGGKKGAVPVPRPVQAVEEAMSHLRIAVELTTPLPAVSPPATAGETTQHTARTLASALHLLGLALRRHSTAITDSTLYPGVAMGAGSIVRVRALASLREAVRSFAQSEEIDAQLTASKSSTSTDVIFKTRAAEERISCQALVSKWEEEEATLRTTVAKAKSKPKQQQAGKAQQQRADKAQKRKELLDAMLDEDDGEDDDEDEDGLEVIDDE